MEIVMEDPTKFLDEIQKALLAVSGETISLPTLCVGLKDLELTRKRVSVAWLAASYSTVLYRALSPSTHLRLAHPHFFFVFLEPRVDEPFYF